MSEQDVQLPLGCVCDPAGWRGWNKALAICAAYNADPIKGHGCLTCTHEENCHVNVTEEFAALQKTSHAMAHMLLSDSDIPCRESRNGLFLALIKDCKKIDGWLIAPDLYEQECLVFGGPLKSRPGETRLDYTEGNPDVDARYPHVVEFINSFF